MRSTILFILYLAHAIASLQLNATISETPSITWLIVTSYVNQQPNQKITIPNGSRAITSRFTESEQVKSHTSKAATTSQLRVSPIQPSSTAIPTGKPSELPENNVDTSSIVAIITLSTLAVFALLGALYYAKWRKNKRLAADELVIPSRDKGKAPERPRPLSTIAEEVYELEG